MFFMACVVTVTSLPMIILYRAKPEIYPSKSAKKNAENGQKSLSQLKKDLGDLM